MKNEEKNYAPHELQSESMDGEVDALVKFFSALVEMDLEQKEAQWKGDE